VTNLKVHALLKLIKYHVTFDLYCMFSFCPTLKEVVWVSPVVQFSD